jgi:hypothetical protein
MKFCHTFFIAGICKCHLPESVTDNHPWLSATATVGLLLPQNTQCADKLFDLEYQDHMLATEKHDNSNL